MDILFGLLISCIGSVLIVTLISQEYEKSHKVVLTIAWVLLYVVFRINSYHELVFDVISAFGLLFCTFTFALLNVTGDKDDDSN